MSADQTTDFLGVDGQAVRAAREMRAAEKRQPEWLWYDNETMRVAMGRWRRDEHQAPYIRLDLALAEIDRLRAALREIAGQTQFVSTDAVQIAREALAHAG